MGLCYGDTCPECKNDRLQLNEGEAQTHDHPGEPPNLYCERCEFIAEPDWGRVEIRKMAEAAANELFREGVEGWEAKRLVMERSGRHIGGTGWCKSAVIDRIAEAFGGMEDSRKSEAETIEKAAADEASAIYGVVRAMHDGVCPKCGCIKQPMEFFRPDTMQYICPQCYFTIEPLEARRAVQAYQPRLIEAAAIFEEWRKSIA